MNSEARIQNRKQKEMRRFKIIGIIGGVLLFLLGFFWLWGKTAQEDVAVRLISQDLGADVAMDGVEMRLGQAGRTLWELKAISATYNQEKQLVLLNAPSIVKHLSKQDLPIQIDAPQGEVNQSSNDIKLWSGVHMQYGPMSLTSDEAVYIQVDETIYLYGDVLLDRQGMQLRAPKGNVHLPTWVVNAFGGVEVIITKDRLTGSF